MDAVETVTVQEVTATAPEIPVVQMTSSRVRLGQSFKTIGYGCASCWADVGAGMYRGRHHLYIIHRERPIHRVLSTVQRRGTKTTVVNVDN